MENYSLDEILLGLAFIILVFLALRAIVLWYWKINTIVKNQEETNKLLKIIAGIKETPEADEAGEVAEVETETPEESKP